MDKKLNKILEELEKRKKIYLQKARKWELECSATKDRKCEIWAEWYRTRAFAIDEAISVIKKNIREGSDFQWQVSEKE